MSDIVLIASNVCKVYIRAHSLTSDDFTNLALSGAANPDGDEDYVEYMKSVQLMFEGLANGKYLSHIAIFPSLFHSICGRDFITFRQWLVTSPYKAKLNPLATE